MKADPVSELYLLLNKISEGTATPEEEQHLRSFLGNAENNHFFREILLKNLTEYNEDKDEIIVADYDRIYRNILNDIKAEGRIETGQSSFYWKARLKRTILYGTGIAALVAISFFLGIRFSGAGKRDLTGPEVKVTYNEISVPPGSKSEVLLPDSTRVILNSGSSIRYRNDFNISNRDIVLKGEAYFKVAKNTNLPLNVNAGNINVKAVGTEFNIKAYDEDKTIETTLIEGKVAISRSEPNCIDRQYLGLLPDQKAIFIKRPGDMNPENIEVVDTSEVQPSNTSLKDFIISPGIEVDKVVAWTQGKLIFRGENLDFLCAELQRKYDVRFNFTDARIKKFRFSGTLLDESIEQVLTVVKLTAPIDFNIEGQKVTLSIDKSRIEEFSKYLK